MDSAWKYSDLTVIQTIGLGLQNHMHQKKKKKNYFALYNKLNALLEKKMVVETKIKFKQNLHLIQGHYFAIGNQHFQCNPVIII